MQEALVVRRETHIPAPPAAVFALLTDPEKIVRWMGTEAQIEPQKGGLYLVNVTGARVARGAFGREEAFAGGNTMVIWGVIFHYFIAFSWTILFFVLSRDV